MAAEPQIATERMVVPNPQSDDPHAGIIVAAGDPIPTADDAAAPFDVDTATGKELDARFGDLDGYPRSKTVDERRAFVRGHIAGV